MKTQLHRAVHAAEHDPANGLLHGYCILCGIPYPCKYVGTPTTSISDQTTEIDKLRAEKKSKRLGDREIMSQKDLFDSEAGRLIPPTKEPEPINTKPRRPSRWSRAKPHLIKMVESGWPFMIIALVVWAIVGIAIHGATRDHTITKMRNDRCGQWCKAREDQFPTILEYTACYDKCRAWASPEK